MKSAPINCSKCGRFIGKDGFPDVYYDDYNGALECGYPLCGKCLGRISGYSCESCNDWVVINNDLSIGASDQTLCEKCHQSALKLAGEDE